MSVYVCFSVCLSVCPRICLLNYTPDLHHIFCTYLWPWLGPPLAALRCVMYIRFYGLRHVCALCPGEYTTRKGRAFKVTAQVAAQEGRSL